MNREIKFRAWDKATKKIYEVVAINFITKDLWLKIDKNKIIGFNFFEVELMQYTGIEDMNLNEICEGDIVTILDSNIGDDEYFTVKHDDEGARFTLESESLVIDFDNIYGYQCEVIGNIYDNPKLLEEEAINE